MIAAVHAALGTQTARCPACRRSAALREEWGCDKPSGREVWSGTCTACLGAGCDACAMRGTAPRERCPSSMTDDEGRAVMRALSAYRNGVLPAEGGWGDQCARGMAMVDLAAMEAGRCQEDAQKRAAQPKSSSAKRGR